MPATEAVFSGYVRPDGAVGTRNVLLVLPVGQCANELAATAAQGIPTAYPFLHTQPCAHLGEDNEAAQRCLIGIGRNPNAAAVLLVGVGCEALDAERIADAIAETGKPLHSVSLSSAGGFDAAVAEGRRWLLAESDRISRLQRQSVPLSSLSFAVKCGGSDTTSALAGNPAIGRAVDGFIDLGASVLFSETTELIGAEHLLAERAATSDVRRTLLAAVHATEQRIRKTGVDPRGIQPTPGNIRGGLTTLEEKSLGGVLKTGTRPLRAAFSWGDRAEAPGLAFMDCPANVPQLLIGWAAAEACLLVFSVGGGLPARIPSLIGTNVGGLPLLPILKVLSNPREVGARAYFDIYAGTILEQRESLHQVADRISEAVVATASGQPTIYENHAWPGHQIWELLIHGPTV